MAEVQAKTGLYRFPRMSLQWQMLAGFLIGLGAGLIVYMTAPDAPWVDTVTRYVTGPIGQIFLRLLFMLVIPLLASALIVGIAEMGEMKALRRIGVRTLIYTVVVSSIAVLISLAAVNLLRPGDGVDPAMARAMLADAGQGAQAILARGGATPTGVAAIIAIVPDNIVAAMGGNDILAVMFFSLFFGIGMVQTPHNAQRHRRSGRGDCDLRRGRAGGFGLASV